MRDRESKRGRDGERDGARVWGGDSGREERETKRNKENLEEAKTGMGRETV